MEMSIETMVGILIAIVILLAILIFLDIIPVRGQPLNAQGRLYLCCQKFLANECNEGVSITCDEDTFETVDELRAKLDLEWDDLKRLCNCPNV